MSKVWSAKVAPNITHDVVHFSCRSLSPCPALLAGSTVKGFPSQISCAAFLRSFSRARTVASPWCAGVKGIYTAPGRRLHEQQFGIRDQLTTGCLFLTQARARRGDTTMAEGWARW